MLQMNWNKGNLFENTSLQQSSDLSSSKFSIELINEHSRKGWVGKVNSWQNKNGDDK